MFTSCVQEATNFHSLTAMTVASFGFQFGRMLGGRLLYLALPFLKRSPQVLNFSSSLIGLGMEVLSFEGTQRALEFRENGFLNNPNLWSWVGEGGWRGSLSCGLMNFGTLKLGNHFFAAQSFLLREFISDSFMVAGHHVAHALNLERVPQGTIFEQFSHAAMMNLGMGAGMVLSNRLMGGKLQRLQHQLGYASRHLSITESRTIQGKFIFQMNAVESSLFSHLGMLTLITGGVFQWFATRMQARPSPQERIQAIQSLMLELAKRQASAVETFRTADPSRVRDVQKLRTYLKSELGEGEEVSLCAAEALEKLGFLEDHKLILGTYRKLAETLRPGVTPQAVEGIARCGTEAEKIWALGQLERFTQEWFFFYCPHVWGGCVEGAYRLGGAPAVQKVFASLLSDKFILIVGNHFVLPGFCIEFLRSLYRCEGEEVVRKALAKHQDDLSEQVRKTADQWLRWMR